MPLPPPRHPPRASRVRERGTVGSARVWTSEERALGVQARAYSPSVADETFAPAPRLATGGAPTLSLVPARPAAPEEAPAWERLDELEHRRPLIARRLRAALAKVDLPRDRQTEVFAKILAWIDESAPAPSAVPGEPASVEEERLLDVLERRLAKVRGSLRTARDLHRQLESLADHDPGVASIYRAVQGLTSMDALLEVKREMLREIFQANFAFQKRTA